MASNNESAALRAATYIIERVREFKPGETDPREIIRAEYRMNDLTELLETTYGDNLHEEEYRNRCKELGLSP